MNIILLTEADRITGHTFAVTDHRAEHIHTVLQSRVGDTVEVGLLDGPFGTGKIEEVSTTLVRLKVTEWREAARPSYEVDIICAVPRPKTTKKVLAIAASMNARSLHFVRANRTDKSYLESPLLQEPERLSYLYDGLSQGKFTRLPNVEVHPLFRPFVEDDVPSLFADRLKLVADPSGDKLTTIFSPSHQPGDVVIAIGPEGGWVPFELDLLVTTGFKPFQLGPWTLRVENALVAALSQLALVAAKESI
ncbi:MAG: RsmE family RNA methyltransferase [Candidatus Zixiibacteriota bacterium]